MKYISLLAAVLIFSVGLFAQAGELTEANRTTIAEQEDELLGLAYLMHTDSAEESRFLACKQLITSLVQALKIPNSFQYDFPKLQGVKIMSAPDNSFRFFSWELHINRDEYRHYGAIQYNEESLKLVPLIDRGVFLRQNPETALTTNEDWLGYVVYNILPGGVYEGKPYYFLFGYDRYAATSRQKFLDVFYFGSDGTPHFGLPVFATYTPEGHLLEDRTRILLEYNAEASVALRHEPETNRIIYENLVISQGPDGGPISLPDGSYHALELGTDGRWHEISKVFNHVYDKAPVPTPKVTEKVNIMGQPRN